MNILVTAIGSMSSEAVIQTLHNEGHNVIATDYYPASYNPISNVCIAFSQMPLAYDTLYCEKLLLFAQANKCEAIIPLTDPEVDALSVNQKLFENAGIKLWLAPSHIIQNVRDKSVWHKLLANVQHFHIIPTYHSYQELTENYTGKFVAKRVKGRSSEGIYFSNTSENKRINENGYIFQPFIEGEICTVDFVVHPQSKEVICVPRIELSRTINGAGTVVRIAPINLFQAAIVELVETLKISGAMNCEFISDAHGQLWLMDINPRFSAGVAFSTLAGYNIIKACIECFTKPSLTPCTKIEPNIILVKRYVEFKQS